MTDIAGGSLGAAGRSGGRLEAMALTRATLDVVRRRPMGILAWWLAWTAAFAALRWLNSQLSLPAGLLDPAGYTDRTLLASLMSAMLVRSQLAAPEARWRIDGRFIAFLLLGLALNAAPSIALTTWVAWSPGLAAPLPRMLATTGGSYVIALVQTALVLWPLGVLMGGPAANPITAVRTLRGAIISLIVAMILFAAAPLFLFGVGTAFAALNVGSDPAVNLRTWFSYERIPVSALADVLTTIAAVELFRIRFVAGRDVADVFD